MRSQRYVIIMFDDQASRWTHVATKMAQRLTQVAPKIPIWLHRRSVRAMFAFQQGMRFLCSMNTAI